jgi:hypothetical protein
MIFGSSSSEVFGDSIANARVGAFGALVNMNKLKSW